MEENSTPQEPEKKVNSEENTWSMLCHLSALIFGFLGPLIIWLIKKDEFPRVDENGKESLNFQISMAIYMIAAGILTLVVIGALLLPILFITDFVLIIIATVKVNKGESYKYPLTIRLIK